MIGDDQELPEDSQEIPSADPQEFREEIEAGVQESQQFADESPDVSMPDQVGELSGMGDAAETEQGLDVPVSSPELPEQAADARPSPGFDLPQSPIEQALGDFAEMGESAMSEADLGIAPPVLSDLEAMGAAAGSEVPPVRTEQEQIQATELPRNLDLFETDAGEMEQTSSGMEFVQALSSKGQADLMWMSLATQMLAEHEHRIRQLVEALERNR